MTNEDCHLKLMKFIDSIRRLGDPERVEPVAVLVEQMLSEGTCPKDEENFSRLIRSLTQRAMGISETAATLTLQLGAD
jgi:hypothetical protein